MSKQFFIANLLRRKGVFFVFTTTRPASLVTSVRKSLTPPVIPQVHA